MNSIFTCGNSYFGLDGVYYGNHLAQFYNTSAAEVTLKFIQVSLGIHPSSSVAKIFPGLIIIIGEFERKFHTSDIWNTHIDLKMFGIPHVLFTVDNDITDLKGINTNYFMLESQTNFYTRLGYSEDCHKLWADQISNKLTLQLLTR